MNVFLIYSAPSNGLIINFTNAITRNDTNAISKILHELIAASFRNNCASGNLWHNHLTYFLLNNENPFALACERRKSPKGSMKDLALHDLAILHKLFRLEHDCMKYVRDFRGDGNTLICELSARLAASKTPEEMYEHVTAFYERYGVGTLAFSRAFRLSGSELVAVGNVGNVRLDDLVGYELQKQELVANTEAFVSGLPANNVLLYGDGGTGKSTSVRAVLNEFAPRGLRVIEMYKEQFRDILRLTELLRKRNYKFIIFIDDLSFEEDESEYKYLKAVIEGGIEARPDNVLIYATSNRRHIIREVWSDRDDMEHNGDIHRSDTVEEKLSLASRFGVAINYSSPTRQAYHDIVRTLAKESGLNVGDDELIAGADRWEIRHGGKTGRTAKQYIDYLLGRK